METQRPNFLRTLLVLGRASNLPTVWSNCIAGWLLGGGGDVKRLLWLCAGATLVYAGGMLLNDAFDLNFDRQHRRERPIPSGAISQGTVWIMGLAFLATGGLILSLLAQTSSLLVLLLLLSVLVYDAIHKAIAFSPLLMAACRFFLYMIAGSCALNGANGLLLWSAAAMAAYIVGLSYLARGESTKTAFEYWPAALLAAPLGLALTVNNLAHRASGLVLVLAVGAWLLWSLRYTVGRARPLIGRTVSNLLAGIVLVDALAAGWQGMEVAGIFLSLFLAALLFQRFIPAT